MASWIEQMIAQQGNAADSLHSRLISALGANGKNEA